MAYQTPPFPQGGVGDRTSVELINKEFGEDLTAGLHQITPFAKTPKSLYSFLHCIQYGLEQSCRASKRDTKSLSLIQTVHLLCNYCMLTLVSSPDHAL